MNDLEKRYQERLEALFEQSAAWLAQLYHSGITPQVEALLAEARDPINSIEIAHERIRMAIAVAQKSLEASAETPEVMTSGGILLFERGDLDGARDLLAQARPLFTPDKLNKIHRGAVTAWLQGIINYRQKDAIEGYKNWKAARKEFSDLEKKENWEKRWEKAQWYQDRLTVMETWAAQTLPEAYFQWMNQFDMLPLPVGLNEIRSNISDLYSQGKYIEVRKQLALFIRNAQREPRLPIYWQALTDAAFVEYLLGDLKEAISHLDLARKGFQSSHRGAVTLWMAGMLRWWLESEQADAELNWQESIRRFTELEQQAEYANEENKRVWYENQIPRMIASLRDWIWLIMP